MKLSNEIMISSVAATGLALLASGGASAHETEIHEDPNVITMNIDESQNIELGDPSNLTAVVMNGTVTLQTESTEPEIAVEESFIEDELIETTENKTDTTLIIEESTTETSTIDAGEQTYLDPQNSEITTSELSDDVEPAPIETAIPEIDRTDPNKINDVEISTPKVPTGDVDVTPEVGPSPVTLDGANPVEEVTVQEGDRPSEGGVVVTAEDLDMPEMSDPKKIGEIILPNNPENDLKVSVVVSNNESIHDSVVIGTMGDELVLTIEKPEESVDKITPAEFTITKEQYEAARKLAESNGLDYVSIIISVKSTDGFSLTFADIVTEITEIIETKEPEVPVTPPVAETPVPETPIETPIVTKTPVGELPVTGGDTVALVASGTALLAVGASMVGFSRRGAGNPNTLLRYNRIMDGDDEINDVDLSNTKFTKKSKKRR